VSGELPDVGAALLPVVESVPEAMRPRFLALLERAAAARYRVWSEEDPAHAAGFLACAEREDEIAQRIERFFPALPDEREAFARALPRVAAVAESAFRGRPPAEQRAMQAAAERRGAEAWRAFAAIVPDKALAAELNACARLEEESAEWLEELLPRR
jgi:hypothetical protein